MKDDSARVLSDELDEALCLVLYSARIRASDYGEDTRYRKEIEDACKLLHKKLVPGSTQSRIDSTSSLESLARSIRHRMSGQAEGPSVAVYLKARPLPCWGLPDIKGPWWVTHTSIPTSALSFTLIL